LCKLGFSVLTSGITPKPYQVYAIAAWSVGGIVSPLSVIESPQPAPSVASAPSRGCMRVSPRAGPALDMAPPYGSSGCRVLSAHETGLSRHTAQNICSPAPTRRQLVLRRTNAVAEQEPTVVHQRTLFGVESVPHSEQSVLRAVTSIVSKVEKHLFGTSTSRQPWRCGVKCSASLHSRRHRSLHNVSASDLTSAHLAQLALSACGSVANRSGFLSCWR
jgi:hypothetical protein